MTVHQATVLFGAVAENTITLGFENVATGERAVLVKPEGMRGWSVGSPASLEEFTNLLNMCYVLCACSRREGMNTDDLKNYINITEHNGKYAFFVHHNSSVLTTSAPLASWYIYASREEAMMVTVKILSALWRYPA